MKPRRRMFLLLACSLCLGIAACASNTMLDGLLYPNDIYSASSDNEQGLALCAALEAEGYYFDEFEVWEIGLEVTYPDGRQVRYPHSLSVSPVILVDIARDYDNPYVFSEAERARLDQEAEVFCQDFQRNARELGEVCTLERSSSGITWMVCEVVFGSLRPATSRVPMVGEPEVMVGTTKPTPRSCARQGMLSSRRYAVIEVSMPGAIEPYTDQFKLREVLNADLLRHLRRVEFPRQHTISVHTPERDTFYLLVAGRVQISHAHLNGKRSVLAELMPLAAIGDLELFNRADFAADVVTHVLTVEDSVLLGLEQSIVRRFGSDDPRFLRFIIHNLSQKLYNTSAAQVGNVLPLANRFASFLLQQRTSGEIVEIPPKEDLAGYLGTTARHLNRVIRQFQERGWIAIEGRTVRLLKRGEVEKMAVG